MISKPLLETIMDLFGQIMVHNSHKRMFHSKPKLGVNDRVRYLMADKSQYRGITSF